MRRCDVLKNSIEFVAFVEHWRLNRRCPLEFSDWLRDQEFEEQANAAFYAATSPPRRIFQESKTGFICPSNFMPRYYSWFMSRRVAIETDDLSDYFGASFLDKQDLYDGHWKSPIFIDAIIFYLDYQGELLSQYPDGVVR
jgi:hypothetical protein